jgi:hypothetical protein
MVPISLVIAFFFLDRGCRRRVEHQQVCGVSRQNGETGKTPFRTRKRHDRGRTGRFCLVSAIEFSFNSWTWSFREPRTANREEGYSVVLLKNTIKAKKMELLPQSCLFSHCPL